MIGGTNMVLKNCSQVGASWSKVAFDLRWNVGWPQPVKGCNKSVYEHAMIWYLILVAFEPR